LEYEDRIIPIPLFAVAIGLMTGFTFIFPILGFITLPTALMVIYSIMTGDISFIDEKPIPQYPDKSPEEE
jgi:hypothetical protein